MSEPSVDPIRVLRTNSRSFWIASLFLPRRVRGKIQTLYAWCRTVDDAVDHAATPAAAARELDRLSDDLSRMRAGDLAETDQWQHPASAWIASLILNDGVDRRDAMDLIDGMRIDWRMDAGQTAIDTDADLINYCYHAAGTVGLMMMAIMGVEGGPDSPVRSQAVALGIAMQLTNVARDVREDAERGRSYLPGVSSLADASDAEVRKRVRHVLQLAEQRYRIAAAGLESLPRDCRLAIGVAMAAYREIGREIIRHDCHVLAGRTIVPPHRLLFVVTRTVLPGVFPMSDSISPTTSTSATSSALSSVNQCKHAVWLGLSLTAFMASALFVMVYVNPKSDAFSTLPLIYAASSLVFAVIANRLAAGYEKRC